MNSWRKTSKDKDIEWNWRSLQLFYPLFSNIYRGLKIENFLEFISYMNIFEKKIILWFWGALSIDCKFKS